MREESKGFFPGFIIGALVGFGIGTLLAPSAGKETREQLKSRGSDLWTRRSEMPESVQTALHDVTEHSRSYVNSIFDRISQAISAGREAAHERREELSAEVEEVTKPA
jgi:gas vesicle protein